MKYSTKLSDALHVLAFLHLGAGQRLTSARIAESVRTNPAYIRQLLAALKHAGLVDSAQGQANPTLTRAPADITMLDVYRAVEAGKPLLHWDVNTNPDCGVGVYVQQSIGEFYGQIQTVAEETMQGITLQDILNRYTQKLNDRKGDPEPCAKP